MSEYIEILIILLVSFILVLYVRNLRNMEKENLRLQKNLNQVNQFFDEVNGRVDDIRRYRHDLNKHIRIVEEFLKEGQNYADYEEYQELVHLISGMQKNVEETRKRRFCDHEVLNAICEIKKKECDQKGVPFDVEIDYQDISWVEDYHLTGIIMNLLDNALEAQQKLDPDETKLMTLTINQPQEIRDNKESLVISVGNTIPKGEKLDFKTRKQDKKHHGMGLDIARGYSEIYSGELINKYDEIRHYLVISITLYHEETGRTSTEP